MALRRHTLAVGIALTLVAAEIRISHGATKHQSESRKEGATVKVIEIVPGKSIGPVALGAPVSSLPKGAAVGELDGKLMGISFTHTGGKIDDVWIDDLRKMRYPIRWDGKLVPHRASLEELKRLFGPCETVPGLKGGMAFTCKTGITLGCDFRGTGKFVQIRLLPDWGG